MMMKEEDDDELEEDDDVLEDDDDDDELEDKLVVFRIICQRHLNSNPCQIGGYSNIITSNLPGFTFFEI